MIFGTFEFLPFLATVIIGYWALKNFPVIRKIFLLLCSAYYYALIDSRFLGLLVGLAFVTYVLGGLIGKNKGKAIAKGYLWAGILANIGVLFWFKYYDFFRVSAQSLFASVGLPGALPYWEILFPIGVSFYTFRMISYLVDIKREKLDWKVSLLDFLFYALFFPIMLAGPIVRATEFLPQLKEGGPKEPADVYTACTLFFLGLFKKIVISSWLASALVDNAFAVPEQIAFVGGWLAVFGYALQIYCDFSGYSDMAMAAAMFLGFKLLPNFNFPYKATSIADFWRRWHISFYLWMRDYIYIPLGGNRKGPVRNFINILAVFALSGLWHGAALHFIIWGIWHGLGLAFERVVNFAKGFSGWLVTFLFVSIGWILFRAENLDRAWAMVTSLFRFSAGQPIPLITIAIFLVVFILVVFEQKISIILTALQQHMPSAIWLLFWVFFAILTYALTPSSVPAFIYFSF